MTEAKKPATPSSSDPLPHDEEEQAPISGARPSSPPADPSLLEKDEPLVDDAPVTDDEAECPAVTRELVNAFIGTQMARDRITQVVS